MPGEPTLSGINDWFLGGSTNMGPDRETALRITARYPLVPEMARAGHCFILSVARQAAQDGVRRFVRAGYVTVRPGQNAHEAVRAIAPGARVAYVTRDDQQIMALGLLGAEAGVTVARARVACPETVLEAEPVAAMIAEGEPVALITGMFYQHADAEWTQRHLETYTSALPPGSVVALSLIAVPDEETAAELGDLFGIRPPGRFYPHAADEARGWGGGLEVVALTPHVTVPGTAVGIVARVP